MVLGLPATGTILGSTGGFVLQAGRFGCVDGADSVFGRNPTAQMPGSFFSKTLGESMPLLLGRPVASQNPPPLASAQT